MYKVLLVDICIYIYAECISLATVCIKAHIQAPAQI